MHKEWKGEGRVGAACAPHRAAPIGTVSGLEAGNEAIGEPVSQWGLGAELSGVG